MHNTNTLKLIHKYKGPRCPSLLPLLLFIWSALGAPSSIAGKPNLVLIITDDQGYGDIGCYGATGFVTPNMDKLASQGIKFTNFYSAQAVCSASRAGLLTGCYPNRIGIHGALFPHHKVGLNPAETTIAEICKDQGRLT